MCGANFARKLEESSQRERGGERGRESETRFHSIASVEEKERRKERARARARLRPHLEMGGETDCDLAIRESSSSSSSLATAHSKPPLSSRHFRLQCMPDTGEWRGSSWRHYPTAVLFCRHSVRWAVYLLFYCSNSSPVAAVQRDSSNRNGATYGSAASAVGGDLIRNRCRFVGAEAG